MTKKSIKSIFHEYNVLGDFLMQIFFKNLFIGLLIGFGAILPGVSSGVFCVIFGIYDKLLESCSSIFKDFKKNFLYLLPFAIGAIIGIFLFGNLIKIFYFKFEIECKFLFIGLILGGIPSLFSSLIYTKKAKSSSNFFIISLKNEIKNFFIPIFIPMFLSFLLGLSLLFIENTLDFNMSSTFILKNSLYLVFCGIIMSSGIIIPGVSNTLILMCLGIYSQYIVAISNINISFLFPLAIGLALGSIFWIKFLSFLLKKYYIPTFSTIIGFTLGSVFVLLPTFKFDFSFILYLLLFIFGLILSYKLSNIEKNGN